MIERYNREAIFSPLKKYDHLAGEEDFIEICAWKNGEGFDVEIVGKLSTRFQLTWGEFEALVKLVPKLDSY